MPKIRAKVDTMSLLPSLCVLAFHPLALSSLSLFTAPSPVMTIKKDRTSRNSISLSWQEPEHPNGIILDYEVKYYEKVGERCNGVGLGRGKPYYFMSYALANNLLGYEW